MKKLAIFDLDGTLINTVADLANSTNYGLSKCGFPTHPVNDYKLFVGNGINKLFERALPEGMKTEENVLRIRKEFLPHYDQHNADDSSPYPYIPELLHRLKQNGMMIAVASNKYQAATEKLVKHYFPEIPFIEVLGQRDNVPPKPDPTIVYDILKKANATKEEAIYIGDSGVDMDTASQAGIVSIGVTWGFRPRTELEAHGAKYIIEHPSEVIDILSSY